MMKSDLLLKLADGLETVPEDRFDMHVFAVASNHDLRRLALDAGEGCGTAGCALGWAPSLLDPRDLDGGSLELVSSRKPGEDDQGDEMSVVHIKADGTRAHGFFAAMSLFGLTWNQAVYLFDGVTYDYDPGPRGVANRIRAFVASMLSRDLALGVGDQEVT